jgi:hypothetical protein
MRAGPRAVVTIRRESARATPTFIKKPRLRRVQRSRLNGPVSVLEPPLLAFQQVQWNQGIDLRTYARAITVNRRQDE